MRTTMLILLVMLIPSCAFLPQDPYEKGRFETAYEYNQRMSGRYLSEQARLTNLYQKCVQEHAGNLDGIKSHCEPIYAPLRLNAQLNQTKASQ